MHTEYKHLGQMNMEWGKRALTPMMMPHLRSSQKSISDNSRTPSMFCAFCRSVSVLYPLEDSYKMSCVACET